MSDKFVSTRCEWNVNIRPTGYQLTLKIRTRETRRRDCRLDHCLILAVQPDQWDEDVRSTMMNAVCCRSSVSHTTSTFRHGSAVAKRLLTRPISRRCSSLCFVSSVSDREVRTLLASRNKHDDVRPTGHGARHPDVARRSRPTQLRTSLQLKRRGTSTSVVHATELHGVLITTDGTGDGGPVDDTNPSILRRNANGRQPQTSRSLTGGIR